ncbi:MAG: hypothetical protein VX777_10385 [Chlamydiota bacterium]|nr:hypothetical protein [Chlamydiota bacterium]
MIKALYRIFLSSFLVIFPFKGYSENKTAQTENPTPSLRKFNSYPKSLAKAVAAIEKMPEIMDLLEKVQRDGPITIKYENMGSFNFEALWSTSTRTIIVNASPGLDRSLGNIITSIVFELHNANTNHLLVKYFEQAQKGVINKDNYVRSIEKMEHENALNTSLLMDLGIERGVFPKEAEWNMYEDFEDHFKLQQIYQHSQWLADKYDELNRSRRRQIFKGTIPGLSKMSQTEKETLAFYLSLKNQTTTSKPVNREKAELLISSELEKFKYCESNSGQKKCSNYKTEKQLFNIIFT